MLKNDEILCYNEMLWKRFPHVFLKLIFHLMMMEQWQIINVMSIKQKFYHKHHRWIAGYSVLSKNWSQNGKTTFNANYNTRLKNMKFLKLGNTKIWVYFTEIEINNKKLLYLVIRSPSFKFYSVSYYIFHRLSNWSSCYVLVTFWLVITRLIIWY